MLTLRFIPVFEDAHFVEAALEYEKIWKKDGEKIVATLEKLTGISFIEKRIAAIVYEGISYSGRGPSDVMKLRASYTADVKKGTLIHELSHRLLFNALIQGERDDHEVINLFLARAWTEIYGTEFTDTMIETEKKLSGRYADMWNAALSLNEKEQQEKYRSLVTPK